VRITTHEPYETVSRDEYYDGMQNPLHFECLEEKGLYVARFFRGFFRPIGADYIVSIGRIVLKPKQRLRQPATLTGYPVVSLQPVSVDQLTIGVRYDTRPVTWEGLILGKVVSDQPDGYFVRKIEERKPPDTTDIAIAAILIESMGKE
jgi:hypothetical protein